MATSSIATLFSFFTPSKPPPAPFTAPLKFPAPHLSTAAASPYSSSTKPRWAPLALSNEVQSSPSSSPDVMSVVYPSVANSNTMFFSTYNVQVVVDEDEPEERLLSRFRREVMRAGIIQECRRRRYYENKQDKKKRKSREAARRNRRRRLQGSGVPQDKLESSKNKEEDEDDNWDLPEGDLPY